MRPDHQEFIAGARLAAIAAVSAVVTATLVIGVGRALLPEAAAAGAAEAPLIRVAAR
ncbi:MAG: hypothetical protein H2038_07465 [Brevundimonas sp.]|uniref:hypothetical protein n=1 Tax=Brevundimonas sp. TaxID=1871086 RepID=UPI0017C360D0|nr:hypothetical protein [Brevundimonas sp.]MBA4804472.1 hypothetical protein [Brevundimonas sp.]